MNPPKPIHEAVQELIRKLDQGERYIIVINKGSEGFIFSNVEDEPEALRHTAKLLENRSNALGGSG